jgi:putative phosphoesterase
MIRVGLLSDTHIPVDAKVIPGQIGDLFRGVDLILHAGDIYETWVLDELEKIAPVLAAEGDDDDYDIASDRRVKKKHTINVGGFPVSLAHSEPGLGPWSVFPDSREDLEKSNHFIFETVDNIVVFGHSHRPKVASRGSFLMLNPGSPTFPYYMHRPGTVAILTINSGGVEVQLKQLR